MPGPASSSCHSGFIICLVIFMGSNQVCPSLVLFTSTNCPVSSGDIPGFEAHHSILSGEELLFQRATIQMVPVVWL